MVYILKLFRFSVALVFILSNFLPWIKLDDTTDSINGIDLAVYLFHGADKLLFLNQNLFMAIGLFVLPVVIIITTTFIAAGLVISIFNTWENRSTTSIINLGKVLLPIVFLMFLVKPFVDESSIQIHAFVLPNIGLTLVLVFASMLAMFEIYCNYKVHQTASINENNGRRL